MIKKLSIFALIIVLCSMVPAPGLAVHAASVPESSAQMASIRLGDPAFPRPAEVFYDPNAVPLKVDPPLPGARPGLQPSSLDITVDYLAAGTTNALGDYCLDYPPAAQTAFTAAANILQSLISSPVQIRIEACWASLPPHVLGHSSATDYWRDFPNAPYPGLFYPVALANALSGTDLDTPSYCTGLGYEATNCDDISLAYASGYASAFYYGTDGNPGRGQIDFESVVLHEIIHGLGFSGILVANKSGSAWYGNLDQAPYPFIYDKFAANSAGVSLTNTATYPRPSTALGAVLVGGKGGVYFSGLNTRSVNGGIGAKLYTPNPWVVGSSYSHLDEIFNGTPNDLMTYAIGNGQSLHNPGPVGLGVLKDVGWAPQPATALSVLLAGNQANLSWTNNGGSPTGFRIERSPNGTDSWASAGTTDASAISFNDPGLAAGDYYYRIVAYNNLGDAYPSNVSIKVTIPLAPSTGLNATPVSTTQINLTWTNNAPTATAAIVQRSLTGVNGSWTTLTTTALPGSTGGAYNDTGPLTEGIRYFYQVIVTDGANQSLPVTANATALLATPTGLVTSAAPTYTKVSLTWTNHSAHQTGYDVYRSDGTPSAFVLQGHSSTTTYSDTSAVAGMLYNYMVCATNATGASADSDLLAVITSQVPPTLFTAVRAGEKVNLSWQDNAANETGYTVERSLDGSTGWVAAGTAPLVPGAGSSGSFTDNNPFELVTQYYRICAVNAFTCSAYVTSTVVAAGATLNAPTPVYSSPVDTSTIRILWLDNSANETGYELEYADNPSGPWTPMWTAGPNVTSYDWVQPDGVYYVHARALAADPALDSPFTAPALVIKSSIHAYFPLLTK